MVSSLIQSGQNLSLQNSQKLQRIRHTCAHILAMAVQKLYPGTLVATGPVTETGFYYDFDSPVSFTPDDLPKIAACMRRIILANLPIIREVVDREQIQAEWVNEKWKPKL